MGLGSSLAELPVGRTRKGEVTLRIVSPCKYALGLISAKGPNGHKSGVVSDINGMTRRRSAPFTAETTSTRRRSDPLKSETTLDQRQSMSVPAVNGLPRHLGIPFSEITDRPAHRSNPLIPERGVERRRSMAVSAVNGTDRCPGGSLSAVNETPVGSIPLKTNDLEHCWVPRCLATFLHGRGVKFSQRVVLRSGDDFPDRAAFLDQAQRSSKSLHFHLLMVKAELMEDRCVQIAVIMR
jgi:hypothetical protein